MSRQHPGVAHRQPDEPALRGLRRRVGTSGAARQQAHTAFFGVQRHSPADASMRAADHATAAIRQALAGSGIATIESFEVMAGHDMPGSRVQFARSTDPDAALQALATLDLTALHASLGDWRDSVGLWCEQFLTTVGAIAPGDTVRDRPDPRRLDIGRAPEAPPADDLPARAADAGLPAIVPFGYGMALSGYNPTALLHLRSGHDGSRCGPLEAAWWQRGLQMLIDLGLEELWRDPVESGAYALRQLVRVDADERHLADTSISGFFGSAADLVRWTDEHAAHVAAYERLLDQDGLAAAHRRLRSYQHLSIVEPGDARFDYVNCGPRTGVIRFVPMGSIRLRVRHDLG